MRAWLIEKGADGKNTIALGEVETPEPGPTEIRIRVAAAGLNRADLVQIMGMYPPPPGTDPRIPGLEYAGVVDKIGERVQAFAPGDRVMGLVPGCAYSEFVTVQEREAIPVPETFSFAEAAAVPEAFMTAYRAVFIEGGLRPGQACLIQPATSGVGLAAAQLVHALGGTAIGSSRSRDRLARAQGLATGVIDGEDDVVQQVREATGGQGVAVVLDMLGGGGRLQQTLDCLRDEGTLVLIGLMTGRKDELDLGQLLRRRIKLKAMTMRSQALENRTAIAQRFMDELLPLFERGALQPVVSEVYPFEEAPAALDAMASNRHYGKLILTLDHS